MECLLISLEIAVLHQIYEMALTGQIAGKTGFLANL
jgi:hypothetical protein